LQECFVKLNKNVLLNVTDIAEFPLLPACAVEFTRHLNGAVLGLAQSSDQRPRAIEERKIQIPGRKNMKVVRVLSLALYRCLVLKRTPQQQADLDHLLARQQQRTAPEYHQWLTPQEFGARFGASHEDLGKLKNWLESRGFQVRSVLNNASVIDFAATAGKIRDEFHTARCIRGNNGH
jgi:hypothetical protein